MHPAPIRPSTLNVQTFEDSESHVYTHVWCTHERAIRRSEKVSPGYRRVTSAHTGIPVVSSLKRLFMASLPQCFKCQNLLQTHRRIRKYNTKHREEKKPVSRLNSKHTPTPFSSQKWPKPRLFTEGGTSSTCEAGRLPGPSSCRERPSGTTRYEPAAPTGGGEKASREQVQGLVCSAAGTRSRTPGRHRCPQRFGCATTRRSGVTNTGTTAPESRSPAQTKALQGKAPEAALKEPSLTSRG